MKIAYVAICVNTNAELTFGLSYGIDRGWYQLFG